MQTSELPVAPPATDIGPKLRRHATPVPPHLRKHKLSYQQRWECTFGKEHVARWHPRSIVELVRKEGKMLLLLVTMGVCASVLDYGVEEGVASLSKARTMILKLDVLDSSAVTRLAAWTAFTASVALLGMLWTRVVDPVAAGSGIPEMKTIISCDQRKEADQFLGMRTLISKAAGLALAMGSGLSVGKEGPFVHTASIIAHNLMKHVAVFHRIFRNDILRRHMYNAACAVGVASTFRAPVGGVLFAIEVTSTVFMVANYWRAFIAAISASLARQFMRMIQETEVTAFHPMFPTTFAAKSFSYPEFAAFALLGVLMGVAGAAYVTLSGLFKRQWKRHTHKHPFLWSCCLLVLACDVLYLPGAFSRLSFATTIADLCSPQELVGAWTKQSTSLSKFLLLPIAAIVRLVATTLATTLPLPAGDFIPTFVAGTAMGRFYGEVLHACFPDSGIVPGGYALVGGAAFVGSATHTVSVAIIAVEFTGQFVYMTPLIVAVLVASGIGSALSVSLYESMIISKGLTYLPLLRVNQLDGIKASDVMAAEFPLIPIETSMRHIRFVLAKYKTTASFPVVDTVESMVFYGCVTRKAMERLVESTVDDVGRLSVIVEQSVEMEEASTTADKQEETRTTTLPPAPSPRVPRRDKKSKHKPPTASPLSLPQREINLKHFQSVTIDSSVLQVDADAPLQTVHLLFEMMKTSGIWVTRHGRLLGWIRRKQLHARIAMLARDADAIVV